MSTYELVIFLISFVVSSSVGLCLLLWLPAELPKKYCAWVRSMSPGERAILIVALLILFSVWLIYDVSK